jgi:predicted ribosomally synthesized peptide with SipW-like signal peptide
MKSILLALIIIIVVASLAAAGTYASFVDTEVSEGNYVQATTLDLYLTNPTGVGEQEGQGVKQTWYWELSSTGQRMEPGDSITSWVNLHSFGTGEADYVNIECVNVNTEPSPDMMNTENPAENAILTAGIGWDDDFDSEIDEDAIDDIDNDGDGLIDEDPPSGTIPSTANRGVYDKDRVMIITFMTYHTKTIIGGEYDWLDYGYFTAADDKNGDGRISLYEFSLKGLHGLTPVPNTAGPIMFYMSVSFATDTIRHGSQVPVSDEYQGDQTDMTVIFTLR